MSNTSGQRVSSLETELAEELGA